MMQLEHARWKSHETWKGVTPSKVAVIFSKLIVVFFSDIDSPQNLVTKQVTENTATVSWDPVQAVIDRYLVRYTSAVDPGSIPGSWEDPLEKEKATHSSILAWRIPWTV